MNIEKDIPFVILEWIQKSWQSEVASVEFVGGGCINSGRRIRLRDGKTFFLKTNEKAPKDMFIRESEGLNALRAGGGPRVPIVYLIGDRYILLEDMNPHTPKPDYWVQFGRQLAILHKNIYSKFGFEHNNYIGTTPQINTWKDDGYLFFAENRLLYQVQLAYEQQLIDKKRLKSVEKLTSMLDELIPEQPASLLHGDLWRGNLISDSFGNPVLIDPAVYYGWAEAELAMTALFGGFPERFYQAYQEIRPLDSGFRHRFPIYNLYHLLNHLNLFGLSYLSEVDSVLQKYSG